MSNDFPGRGTSGFASYAYVLHEPGHARRFYMLASHPVRSMGTLPMAQASDEKVEAEEEAVRSYRLSGSVMFLGWGGVATVVLGLIVNLIEPGSIASALVPAGLVLFGLAYRAAESTLRSQSGE